MRASSGDARIGFVRTDPSFSVLAISHGDKTDIYSYSNGEQQPKAHLERFDDVAFLPVSHEARHFLADDDPKKVFGYQFIAAKDRKLFLYAETAPFVFENQGQITGADPYDSCLVACVFPPQMQFGFISEGMVCVYALSIDDRQALLIRRYKTGVGTEERSRDKREEDKSKNITWMAFASSEIVFFASTTGLYARNIREIEANKVMEQVTEVTNQHGPANGNLICMSPCGTGQIAVIDRANELTIYHWDEKGFEKGGSVKLTDAKAMTWSPFGSCLAVRMKDKKVRYFYEAIELVKEKKKDKEEETEKWVLKETSRERTLSGLNPEAFKATVKGKAVDLYVLTNANGSEVCISNFGAIIVSFVVKDKSGKPTDIVLGQPSIEAYYKNPTTFLGATIGRYSNRICAGKFTLDGREYTLPINNGKNNLHSGDTTGFHNKVFDVIDVTNNSVVMKTTSPDRENGFPGTVQVEIRWTLNDDNELIMDTKATTDRPTVCSITNHSFFNLEGGNCDALGAKLQINGDWFLPSDPDMIPTGEMRPVAGTNFDFRTPRAISERIDNDDEQLEIGAGYDHTFVLTKKVDGELRTAAMAFAEKTGIVLEVKTTLPGVHLYSGNFLNGTAGKIEGTKNNYRYAFCLEAQFFPDSPNHSDFPSAVITMTNPYHHIIVFKAFAQ